MEVLREAARFRHTFLPFDRPKCLPPSGRNDQMRTVRPSRDLYRWLISCRNVPCTWIEGHVNLKESSEWLGAFTAYFEDLLLLVSGPKRFVADRVAQRDETLWEPVVFLGVSQLIVIALNLIFTGDKLWPPPLGAVV